MSATTKDTILLLMERAAHAAEFEGWDFRKTKRLLTAEIGKGVLVSIDPGWHFKMNWAAISEPSVTIESAGVNRLYKTAFGRIPKQVLFRHSFGFLWREEGLSQARVTFVEDAPNLDRKERLIDEVPEYLRELKGTCDRLVVPRYDLSSEEAFWASCPDVYAYNKQPITEPFSFIIMDALRGNSTAVQDYIDNEKVPSKVKERQSADLDKLSNCLSSEGLLT